MNNKIVAPAITTPVKNVDVDVNDDFEQVMNEVETDQNKRLDEILEQVITDNMINELISQMKDDAAKLKEIADEE